MRPRSRTRTRLFALVVPQEDWAGHHFFTREVAKSRQILALRAEWAVTVMQLPAARAQTQSVYIQKKARLTAQEPIWSSREWCRIHLQSAPR